MVTTVVWSTKSNQKTRKPSNGQEENTALCLFFIGGPSFNLYHLAWHHTVQRVYRITTVYSTTKYQINKKQ